MGLIEEAIRQRRLHPIDGPWVFQAAQHLLDSANAREEFRRESDLAIEDLDQAPRAEAGSVRIAVIRAASGASVNARSAQTTAGCRVSGRTIRAMSARSKRPRRAWDLSMGIRSVFMRQRGGSFLLLHSLTAKHKHVTTP